MRCTFLQSPDLLTWFGKSSFNPSHPHWIALTEDMSSLFECVYVCWWLGKGRRNLLT